MTAEVLHVDEAPAPTSVKVTLRATYPLKELAHPVDVIAAARKEALERLGDGNWSLHFDLAGDEKNFQWVVVIEAVMTP